MFNVSYINLDSDIHNFHISVNKRQKYFVRIGDKQL